MRLFVIGFSVLAAAALSEVTAAGAQIAGTDRIPPAMHCADLIGLHLTGSTMTIAKATAVPESPPDTVQYMPPFPMKVPVAIPPYCPGGG